MALSLLLLGCIGQQQQSGALPSPTVVALPDTVSTPIPSPTLAPTAAPTAVAPTVKPTPAPTAAPTAAPAATAAPAPTTSTSSSSVEAFARSIEPALKKTFNTTKKFYTSSYDEWVADEYTSKYSYQVYARFSKNAGWSALDSTVNVTGKETNRTKQVAMVAEGKGAYYSYIGTMPCDNWKYEIYFELKDFEMIYGSEFKRAIGPQMLSNFADICLP